MERTGPGPGPAGDSGYVHPEEQEQEQEPREGSAAPQLPAGRPPSSTSTQEQQPAPVPASPSLGDEGQQPSCSSTGRAEDGREVPAPGEHSYPSGAWDSPKNPGRTLPHELDPIQTDNELVDIPFDCEKYLEDISNEELGKLSKNEEFFRIRITDFLLIIYMKKRPGLLRHSRKYTEILLGKETSQEMKYNSPVPPQHSHLVDGTSMMECASISATGPFSGRFSPMRERRDSDCSTSDDSAQAENVASAQAMEDTDRPQVRQPDFREASDSSCEQKPREKRKRSLTGTSSPTTSAGESEDENSPPPKKRRHHSC